MFEKKFNWKIWFFIILFGATLLMSAYAVFLLLTNQIADENGAPLHPVIVALFCFMICLVCSTYLPTFIALVKQVFVHKNTAFRIDEDGIHNTVVFVYLFAFVIVSPVKFIPWSAVRYIDDEEKDAVYIRVKKKQVSASFIGKLILGIFGYHFLYSFTARLSPQEKSVISSYCKNQPDCRTPDNITFDVLKF